MAKRIVAVIFIYVCTVLAWLALGANVSLRTQHQDARLKSQVGQLWGTAQRQPAPVAYFQTEHEIRVETKKDGETTFETKREYARHLVPIEGSEIAVHLDLDYRKKGLLWYSTYRVNFSGKYRIANPEENPGSELFLQFTFPNQQSVYDNFRLSAGGKDLSNLQVNSGTVKQALRISRGNSEVVEIEYSSQGLDEWWYDFGADVTQVKDFSLSMTTGFDEIDFPENSISPTAKEPFGSGWRLNWNYKSLLSGVKIGLAMPHKLNPGPWVSKVIFSAPVSLFLFFFLIFLLTTIREIKIHPMNYFFLGGAFFSFHLLLAYLVDHISIHLAFAVSSFVSILLVVTYMRLVAGRRFAFVEAGLSQFVYLVLFSYTFFFEEFTGLAVTILCILTLFLVMQFTGRVDWERRFSGRSLVAAVPQGLSCPYCRSTLQDSGLSRCHGCGTLHHETCWNQHGGCAIFGCRPATVAG